MNSNTNTSPQVNGEPYYTTESVPPIFTISDLKNLYKIPHMKTSAEFYVWFPKRACWTKYGYNQVVEGYDESLEVILIRQQGADILQGFYPILAEEFTPEVLAAITAR